MLAHRSEAEMNETQQQLRKILNSADQELRSVIAELDRVVTNSDANLDSRSSTASDGSAVD